MGSCFRFTISNRSDANPHDGKKGASKVNLHSFNIYSSRLFQLTYFVKSWINSPRVDFLVPYPSSERERKFVVACLHLPQNVV